MSNDAHNSRMEKDFDRWNALKKQVNAGEALLKGAK
jgi:hypothetical protein